MLKQDAAYVAMYEAFLNAIETSGMAALKNTSMFGSNDRKISLKAAA